MVNDLAPDDADIRRIWRQQVLPELRVPCSLHITARHLRQGTNGMCWRDDRGRWHVCIRPGMPYMSALDTLVHELAHLAGMMAEDAKHDDHGPLWGVAYSHWFQIVYLTP